MSAPVAAVPVAAVAQEQPTDRRGIPAGLVSRGLAFVIDTVLLAVTYGIVTFTVQSLLEALGGSDVALSDVERWVAVGMGGATSIVAYNTVLVGLLGKTVGMMAVGLRVVQADGMIPGLVRSLVRSLAFLPSSVMLVGFLWVAVDNRRRSWPDHIARTYVVYDWRAVAVSRRPSRLNEPLVPRW